MQDDGGEGADDRKRLDDADALARSRARFQALVDDGWKLSEIARASIGFKQTNDGKACLRAWNREAVAAYGRWHKRTGKRKDYKTSPGKP